MLKVCLFSISIALLFISCKKGDEDPALSLMTRKARLTGAWNLSSAELTSENGYNVTNQVYCDGVETRTTTYTSGSIDTVVSVGTFTEHSLTIMKDGTWKSIESAHYDNRTGNGITYTLTTFDQYRTESGTWGFVNKTKGEFKNKERIIFDRLSDSLFFSETIESQYMYGSSNPVTSDTVEEQYYTGTYSVGDQTEIMELLRLSNKEMKWVKKEEHTNVNGPTNTSTYTYNSDVSKTWTKD